MFTIPRCHSAFIFPFKIKYQPRKSRTTIQTLDLWPEAWMEVGWFKKAAKHHGSTATDGWAGEVSPQGRSPLAERSVKCVRMLCLMEYIISAYVD